MRLANRLFAAVDNLGNANAVNRGILQARVDRAQRRFTAAAELEFRTARAPVDPRELGTLVLSSMATMQRTLDAMHDVLRYTVSYE